MTTRSLTHLVIGGGAAGIFGAIRCAQQFPHHRIFVFEKTRQLLAKVRISGGGRCNVTHACFDPAQLVKNYPRGNRELRGPFSQFQPQDTIHWFESRGVTLKIEEDGRMFPTTDSSETIIQCLLEEAKKVGVQIHLEHGIQKIIHREDGNFILETQNGDQIEGNSILMTTGSSPKVYPLLEQLGHTFVPLVPSLFTFNLPESPFLDLAGISVPQVSVRLSQFEFENTGPLLLTHWGISGPAVLKLSAWAARELHSVDYHTEVILNWFPSMTEEKLRDALLTCKREQPARMIAAESPLGLPKQLWKRLLMLSEISDHLRWSEISHKFLQSLISQLRHTVLNIKGKTTYKQEFVTCGGIPLNEVNFKTMESRKCPRLYFAGEILDIDGITGGFNFQNAWTTGWIAGSSMGKSK